MLEGLTQHVLIAAIYATASASRRWEDRPSPPLAQAAQDVPARALPPRTSTKSSTCEHPGRRTPWSASSSSSAGTQWTAPRSPRKSTSSNTRWTVDGDNHGKVRRAAAQAPDD